MMIQLLIPFNKFQAVICIIITKLSTTYSEICPITMEKNYLSMPLQKINFPHLIQSTYLIYKSSPYRKSIMFKCLTPFFEKS